MAQANRSEKALIAGTKSMLADLDTALAIFKTDMGYYPTTADGLDLLTAIPSNPPPKWNGPYFRFAVPMDPWMKKYHYVCPGVLHPDSYDLSSAGPDSAFGTADDLMGAPLVLPIDKTKLHFSRDRTAWQPGSRMTTIVIVILTIFFIKFRNRRGHRKTTPP